MDSIVRESRIWESGWSIQQEIKNQLAIYGLELGSHCEKWEMQILLSSSDSPQYYMQTASKETGIGKYGMDISTGESIQVTSASLES